MLCNLNERIYQSDFHDHIELFYSAARRKIGGNTGSRKKTKEISTLVGNFNKQSTIVFHTGKPSKKFDEILIKKAESQERSLRRTRAEMTRFYNTRLYGHHVRFVTLTYAVAPESEKQARNDLYLCIDRLSKATGKTIHWLAVPEHGSKNGRFHWHVLLNCSYIRNEEFQNQYWKKGFCKLERVKKKKGYTMDDAALFYIMKYIQKDFADSGTWKHRYFRSRGHKVTQHINAYECHTADFEKFCEYVKAHNFIPVKKESWKDDELGLCVRCHFVRKKTETFSDDEFRSFYWDWKILYLSPDSYDFVTSPEMDDFTAECCDDFPTDFEEDFTSALKKKFYDKAFSTETWIKFFKMWYQLRHGEIRVAPTRMVDEEGDVIHVIQSYSSTKYSLTFEEFIFKYLTMMEEGHHNKISA